MSLKIIGIDPGVTTGIAIHEVLEGGVNPIWQREELGPEPHHLDLWTVLTHQQPDVIVCERFDYQNVTLKGAEMPGIRLESREYIGICALYEQYTHRGVDCELVMSPRTNKGKKALISPDKLKGLDLYRAPGGRQHMNDATAHLLHYVVVNLKRVDYLAKLRPTQ